MGSCSSTSSVLVPERRRSTAKPSLHRPRKLPERDAWHIALAWGEQLQGCVVLVTDEEPVPTSIISTFDWIRFRFDGTDKKGLRSPELLNSTAAYARAATLAWFALSCCGGYSGAENPDFWRRVFLKLLLLRSTREQLKATDKLKQYEQPQPYDPVGFFANTEKPFPRVMLRTRGPANPIATANDIFLGRQAYPDETREATLQQIFVKLDPFIRADHWARRVPVAVDDISCGTISALLCEASRGRDACDQEPVTTFPFRQMQLVSLRLCEGRVLDLHASPGPQSSPETTIGCPSCCLPPRYLERLRWRVRWRELAPVTSQDMGIMCSDLSLVRTARHLNLDSISAQAHERKDWAWLGYAVFHPDTASQSDLTSLEISLKDVREEDLVAFGNMALGNNLQLHDTVNRPSSAYVQGRVARSTEVWSRSRVGGFTIQTVLDADTWISLCVPSASAVQPFEWIRVVNPGFGFGWIHCRYITKFRSCSLSASCVRALRVIIGSGDEVDEHLITRLLLPLGGSLTTLHIVDSAPVSKNTLHAILRLCPSLISLSVHHDGSLWAKAKRTHVLPPIEELQLTTDSRLQRLNTKCLPHLRALHVVSSLPNSFGKLQDVFYAFLSRQKTLLYLHWSRCEKLSNNHLSGKAFSREILLPRAFDEEMEDWAIQVADNPLLLRLHFLRLARDSKKVAV